MKKRTSSKSNAESAQVNPAVMGLIGAMQQQLANIEKKIDAILSKSSSSQPSERRFPTLFQRAPQHSQQAQPREERKDNNFRERVLHKAVCADCNKPCEVPFKPTGDRPVYCKDCFSKRRSSVNFQKRADNRPAPVSQASAVQSEKKPTSESRKSGPKKKTAARGRKKSK